MDWDPRLYLRYGAERTRPCTDLVQRIALEAPARIADLGCGPANSTAVLRQRWPDAQITGFDNSVEMISEARRALPACRFELADIAAWSGAGNWDLVFSNAAFQWVPDHAALLPRLISAAAEGGALAFQVPAHFESPVHLAMVESARHPRWSGRLGGASTRIAVAGPEFYYDALRPLAQRVDLWITVYQHVMAGPEAIIEWMRGTGMRPYLDALADHREREQFESMVLDAIHDRYPRRADGNVLFPFRRLFVIAYR